MKLQKLRWNFNPLSLYRERQVRNKYGYVSRYISIHSPYTGRDDAILRQFGVDVKYQSTLPIQGETKNGREAQGRGDISIHSPYTGRDLYGFRRQDYHPAFQSTLPIQGETTFNSSPQALIQHFNPLSLYRERLLQYLVRERALLFQSTLPIQGETMGQRWTDG